MMIAIEHQRHGFRRSFTSFRYKMGWSAPNNSTFGFIMGEDDLIYSMGLISMCTASAEIISEVEEERWEINYRPTWICWRFMVPSKKEENISISQGDHLSYEISMPAFDPSKLVPTDTRPHWFLWLADQCVTFQTIMMIWNPVWVTPIAWRHTNQFIIMIASEVHRWDNILEVETWEGLHINVEAVALEDALGV